MTRTFILAALAVAAVGCSRTQHSSPQAISTEPLPYDPALGTRQWNESTAYFANGDTLHQPSGFNYSPDDYGSNPAYSVIDTGVFALNVVTLPYFLVMSPPWITSEVSQGVVLAPSYHAMPPLPPSPVSADDVTTISVKEPTTEASEAATQPAE